VTLTGWPVTLLFVASAATAAEEGTAQAAASDDQSSVPEVALPGSTGTVAAGKGSGVAGRIEVARPSERGAGVATKDLPTWLGELLGLKKPPPPGDAEKKPAKRHLTIIPFVSSSPVTGVGFGVAAAGTTQHGEAENTSLSTYSLSFTLTTQSQYALTNRHDLRFAGDDWGLTGMARWTRWPSPTWGIGGNTSESAKSTMDYQLVRLYELVSRRLFGSLYAGAGYSFDWYFSVRNSGSASGQPTEFSTYPYGTGSTSLNSGPALSVVWDTRDSPVYPTRGIVADFNYTFFPTWLGSGTTWHNVYLDLRSYHQLAPWLLLALWTYGSFTFGDVPYLELASNGSAGATRVAEEPQARAHPFGDARVTQVALPAGGPEREEARAQPGPRGSAAVQPTGEREVQLHGELGDRCEASVTTRRGRQVTAEDGLQLQAQVVGARRPPGGLRGAVDAERGQRFGVVHDRAFG